MVHDQQNTKDMSELFDQSEGKTIQDTYIQIDSKSYQRSTNRSHEFMQMQKNNFH